MTPTVRSTALLLAAFAATGLTARAGAQANPRQVIGNSTATLSPAIRWGDFVFVSGQLGVSRAAPDSTAGGQTKVALETMRGILEQAGTSMANVVKCTVFLVDFKDFGPMNTAYATAFASSKEPPARSTVIVAALVSTAAKVEIECIAGVPK